MTERFLVSLRVAGISADGVWAIGATVLIVVVIARGKVSLSRR